MIAANPEASRLYASLEDSLTELDSIKYEPCPDNLAELTVARLKLAASARTGGNSKLRELLKEEQDNRDYLPVIAVQTGAGRFWKPVFELLATAAAIVLVAGILIPSFGAVRQRSRQILCANNLGRIGRAMAAFSNEHDGRISQAVIPSGSPWWKIGYQGPEIQSNTRHAWQLVKGGYVDGHVFVCAGHTDGTPVRYEASEMAALDDFPSRRHISYSFVIMCDKNNTLTQRPRRIIVGDLNPLFQQVPFKPSVYRKLNEFERILLDEQLRQMMSANHRNCGQNVLFSDNSTEFIKTRVVNGDDDIFTIQGVDAYTGKESPCNPDDIFLVP